MDWTEEVFYNPVPELVADELALDVALQPGTYWIAAQYDVNASPVGNDGIAGGDAFVEDFQVSYIDPPNGIAPVPEPPTIWLFMVAAVGFVLLKRKSFVFGRLT